MSRMHLSMHLSMRLVSLFCSTATSPTATSQHLASLKVHRLCHRLSHSMMLFHALHKVSMFCMACTAFDILCGGFSIGIRESVLGAHHVPLRVLYIAHGHEHLHEDGVKCIPWSLGGLVQRLSLMVPGESAVQVVVEDSWGASRTGCP